MKCRLSGQLPEGRRSRRASLASLIDELEGKPNRADATANPECDMRGSAYIIKVTYNITRLKLALPWHNNQADSPCPLATLAVL